MIVVSGVGYPVEHVLYEEECFLPVGGGFGLCHRGANV